MTNPKFQINETVENMVIAQTGIIKGIFEMDTDQWQYLVMSGDLLWSVPEAILKRPAAVPVDADASDPAPNVVRLNRPFRAPEPPTEPSATITPPPGVTQ